MRKALQIPSSFFVPNQVNCLSFVTKISASCSKAEGALLVQGDTAAA